MKVMYLAEPRSWTDEQENEEAKELQNADFDQLVDALVTNAPGFDRIEPGLGNLVLRETLRIASWARQDWRSVWALLRPEERSQGLSGRPNLAAGTGMLFVFEQAGSYAFWMKDMRFPLDMVWIDAQCLQVPGGQCRRSKGPASSSRLKRAPCSRL